mgnify:CR=1 FL=1
MGTLIDPVMVAKLHMVLDNKVSYKLLNQECIKSLRETGGVSIYSERMSPDDSVMVGLSRFESQPRARLNRANFAADVDHVVLTSSRECDFSARSS